MENGCNPEGQGNPSGYSNSNLQPTIGNQMSAIENPK